MMQEREANFAPLTMNYRHTSVTLLTSFEQTKISYDICMYHKFHHILFIIIGKKERRLKPWLDETAFSFDNQIKNSYIYSANKLTFINIFLLLN